MGILETIFAIITISEHGHSWETMPFIDPLLWLSWLTIANLANAVSKYLATLSYAIATVIYVVCLWLCIGYDCKGYGTAQYDIINIPSTCQQMDISWQTDPRRHHFVSLQSVMLAAASLGVFITFYMELAKLSEINVQLRVPKFTQVMHRSPSSGTHKVEYGGNPETESTLAPYPQSNSGEKEINIRITNEMIQSIVGACIVIPAMVGTILAGAVNNGDYLILAQNGCYASYVSSRTGYIGMEFVEWKTKLGVLIGLIT